MNDFKQFIQQRELAAKSYVIGDAKLVDDISAQRSPASFFPPYGGFQQGAENVRLTYLHDSKNFKEGGDTYFEILHMDVSDNLAYWVALQKASVFMHANIEPISMNLRVTEIFRREDDEWKLIHRHADMLAFKNNETIHND